MRRKSALREDAGVASVEPSPPPDRGKNLLRAPFLYAVLSFAFAVACLVVWRNPYVIGLALAIGALCSLAGILKWFRARGTVQPPQNPGELPTPTFEVEAGFKDSASRDERQQLLEQPEQQVPTSHSGTTPEPESPRSPTARDGGSG